MKPDELREFERDGDDLASMTTDELEEEFLPLPPFKKLLDSVDRRKAPRAPRNHRETR